jgi:ArsR family transcriptional regulator, arsenate/arsenite/antimonite-responsive transcriptional repressor
MAALAKLTPKPKSKSLMSKSPKSKTTSDAANCCASLIDSALDDETAAFLAESFAALGDPARLRLLSLIATAPTGEACACDLIEPIGKSQPTVSHHLKILTDAQLIHREKRGVWAWYRANNEKLELLRSALK